MEEVHQQTGTEVVFHRAGSKEIPDQFVHIVMFLGHGAGEIGREMKNGSESERLLVLAD